MSCKDTTSLHTTPRRGGSGGTTFCDTSLLGDISTAAIKQITTAHQDIVYQLKVTPLRNNISLY